MGAGDAAADALGASLVVDAGGARDAVGRPEEHDVGQQRVLREARLDIAVAVAVAVAVAEGTEFLRDLGGDPGGGVRLGDAEGLGLGARTLLSPDSLAWKASLGAMPAWSSSVGFSGDPAMTKVR